MDGSKRSILRRAVLTFVTSAASLALSNTGQGQTPPVRPDSPKAKPANPTSLGKPGVIPGQAATAKRDAAVRQINHDDAAYPSSQQPVVQAPLQPFAAQPSFAPPQAAPAVPSFVPQAVPMAAPASMVQVPAMVYMTQAAAPAANNFFLPAAPMAAAPMAAQPFTAMPMTAMTMTAQPMAAAPIAAAPMAAVPMAAAPMAAQPLAAPAATATALASVTNQSIAMGTTQASTRTRVRGPGLIGSSLARFGERLTQLGRLRIETIQETEFANQLPQQAGPVATLSTLSATPLMAPQVSAPAMPQMAPPPPPMVPQAAPPAPSPQEMQHKHHFLHKH